MLVWTAIYNDGTELCQYNDDDTENKYADIDRTRLSEFRLTHENDGSLVFHLYLDEGQRLIFRKRTRINVFQETETYYLAGWQMTVGGENIQSIAYIHETGSPVFMAGKFREAGWFTSIVPVESEVENGVYVT